MFKGNFVVGTQIPANTNIPIQTILKTNSRISNDTVNNTLQFNTSGLYKVNANLVVGTVTGTSVMAQLYENGVPIVGATAQSDITSGTGVATLPLQDAFRVVSTLTPNLANVSVRCNLAVTPIGGNVIAEYVQ